MSATNNTNEIKEAEKVESKGFTKKQKMIGMFLMLFVLGIVFTFLPEVQAYTVPGATDPGYPIYDLVVTKGLEGPIGFAIGAWLLVNAGSTLGENPKVAALKAIGGGAMIKAESVATTLGWVI